MGMFTRSSPRRLCDAVAFPTAFWAACFLAAVPPGYALPTGGQVVAGEVSLTQSGTAMTLTQASRHAIVNWQSFNIGVGEQLQIAQPGTDAAMLARVIGHDPSQLLGTLKADGKLFLINRHGILVGAGATIDTAAFLASTLDVADADFLNGGALTLKGDSTVGVVNLGQITAREGHVLLLAHTVENAGEIAAANGTAGLGAGTEVYLASPDAPSFVIKTNVTRPPDQTATKVGVDNSGVIAAAQAQLEAAGGSLYDLAVNHSGVIKATGVERQPDGRILLTAAGGNVAVTGSARARDADGAGGEILIGGDYQGKNSAVANAANTLITATASLDASAAAASASGGRVIVWADNATRYSGALSARGGAAGGDGGFAEVSGQRRLLFTGTSDLSAPAGQRGTLLLDPDNITIVAGTTPEPPGLTNGPPVTWPENVDPGDHDFGAANLVALLANNSVHLSAANTITVNAPVVVAAGGTTGVELSLRASTIAINQTVSLANVVDGSLSFIHGGSAVGTRLTTAAGATIAAPRIRVGSFPITTLNGAVSTAKLSYDGLSTATSFTATNPANAIAKFVLNTDPADPHAADFTGNVAVHSGTAMAVSAMIGAANDVTFSSAGDLTLRNDGSDVSVITASGTTKLASTGGVLVNDAGAALLAGTGRRLLYTAALDGAFTLGGLTGYTQFDGVSYPNDPNAFVARVLYHAAGGGPTPTLTITANDFIKLYGQPDPLFTASYAGGTAADLTTLPSFSILEGAHVNVGTYTIVPAGAASTTHALAYVNGTLRIDPALLTYVANPAQRFYGDANSPFSGTVTGFVAGDTLASATTGTLSFTSPATTTSNAGTYAIHGGGLTANFGNYVFQDAPANLSALTIDRAPLTVAFANATRTYGAANPEFVPTFTGFRNGDTPAVLTGYAWGTTATAHSPVGDYAIGASGASGVLNYAITTVPATLTITPATLTYVADPASRIYGATNPLFGGTVTGFVNGETLASATTGTLAWASPAAATSTVGAYAVNGSGLTANQGNYVFTQAASNASALAIGRAPLTLEGRHLTAVYGSAIPALGYTLTGPNGTPEAAELAGLHIAIGQAFFSGTPAGTYSFDLTVSGTAQNYEITRAVPGQLTIAPAPLTLRGEHVTVTFGDPIPTPGYSVSGLIGADTVAVLSGVSLGREFPSGTSPGNYEIGFISTGTAQNYVVTEVVNGSVTVVRRPLTISAHDLTTVMGAIPPFSSTMTGHTVAGAPPFEVRYQIYQKSVQDGLPILTPVSLSPRTPPGDYVIRPVLEFDHLTSGHPQAVYDISLVDGTLSLKPSSLDLTKIVTSNSPEGGTLIITGSFDVSDFNKPDLIDFSPTHNVVVKFGGILADALTEGRSLLGFADPLDVNRLMLDADMNRPGARDQVASLISRAFQRSLERGTELSPAMAKLLPAIIDELNAPKLQQAAEILARYKSQSDASATEVSSIIAAGVLTTDGGGTQLMESGKSLAQEIAALRILPRDATPEQFLQAYVLPKGTDSQTARTRGDISRQMASAVKNAVQRLYEGNL
jgi:filamentous hemagglutinin family protein